MTGLFTIETVDPHVVYVLVGEDERFQASKLHCFSRLPMRQLLRFIPSNRGQMWWISEQEQNQSISPLPESLLNALQTALPGEGDVVIVESLDWFVSRAGENSVLNMLQQLDGISRNEGFTVVFAVEPLSFETRFWIRLRSLAPLLSVPRDEVAVQQGPEVPEKETAPENDSPNDEGRQLTHLVSLPRLGFNTTLLVKRMLQWKRMGFDLSELEPATLAQNTDAAFDIYALVEGKIRVSVDALRLMEEHQAILTVTERERFRFRFMSLHDIEAAVEELERLISTR